MHARTVTSAHADTATWMNKFAYFCTHTHRQMLTMQVVDIYKEQKDLYALSAMFVHMSSRTWSLSTCMKDRQAYVFMPLHPLGDSVLGSLRVCVCAGI